MLVNYIHSNFSIWYYLSYLAILGNFTMLVYGKNDRHMKIKAIDYDDNEHIFENPEIIRHFGTKEPIFERCGDNPLFGFIQCPKCKEVGNNESCGQLFVAGVVQNENEETFVNNIPVKKWEIVP